jgi:AraC-like DNA-binding protein
LGAVLANSSGGTDGGRIPRSLNVQSRRISTWKGIVKKLLAGQRPTLRDVARELRLSARTLQRRLTAEHANFQQLMEDARRELAQHYLLHSSLELNETAYLLGYQDANSFFRAFHQWEGTSPGEWRAVPAHRGASNHASASVA